MDELEEKCFQLKRRIELLKRRIANHGVLSSTSDHVGEVRGLETEIISKKTNKDITAREISYGKSDGDTTQRTKKKKNIGRRKSSDNSTSDEDAAREKAVNRLLLAIEAAGIKD